VHDTKSTMLSLGGENTETLYLNYSLVSSAMR
jgi:hypothetical protein